MNIACVGAQHQIQELEQLRAEGLFSSEHDLVIFFQTSIITRSESLVSLEKYRVKTLQDIAWKSNVNVWRKSRIELRRIINEIVDSRNRIDTVFNAVSLDIAFYISSISNCSITLLDDGFGIFSNLEFFSAKGKYNNWYKQSFIKYALCGLVLKNCFSRISFVSTFDLSRFGWHGKYYLIRSKDKISLKVKNDGKVLLGTPLVELNVMNRDFYLGLIKQILNIYPDQLIYYFPHRRESDDKLESIKNLGFKLVDADDSIEEYLKINGGFRGYIFFANSYVGMSILRNFNVSTDSLFAFKPHKEYYEGNEIAKIIVGIYKNLDIKWISTY